MSRLQPPQFISDLYRDLRDRRLLLPAAVLVVALIGVPVLLSGGSETPPPTPSPVAADATEVSSAVLVEETGVRDYRKRLEALESQNPFQQKFAAPDAESASLEAVASSSSSDGGAATAAAGDLSDAGGSVAGSAPATSDSVSDAPTGTPAVGTEPDAPAQPTRVVEERFYAFRIDVAVGPIGKVKKVEDVRELDFLPSAKDPVVAFLGVDERGKQATFVLEADIVGSRGDGRCLGGGDAGLCEFLVLKPGDERIFDLGAGVPAQRLKLLDVRAVEVKDPTGSG
jgi:hypothetical protein